MFKVNKKIIYLLTFICLLGSAHFALAQGLTNPLSGVNDFKTLFTKLAEALGAFVGSLCTLMILVAGILYLTSAGDSGRIAKAKAALVFAVVGSAIGFGVSIITDYAYGISNVENLDVVISTIVQDISGIVGGLSTVMFIIAGIFYVLSGGVPERIKVAKATLIFAVAGIVIALLATPIKDFIQSLFS
jgi:ABC-type polysaccharide/polyol phosphate export permease